MQLTLKRKAIAIPVRDDDFTVSIIPIGEVVEYLGHVSGGMVKVRRAKGEPVIIHPETTVELST